MKLFILILVPFLWTGIAQSPDPYVILDCVDQNMLSTTKILEGKMVVYGKRNTRTITFRSYSEGIDKSFTEYLSPAREAGTKMLKLKDNLWIYSPAADRTIQISGHMLKQSVMGSDMSYEDMMEDRKLKDVYDATVTGEETVDGRDCWILELNAIVEDVAYEKMKIWVDQQRYVPLREELYAKSGQLLKRAVFSDVQRFGSRWYPTKINYRDVLKNGKGTDFIVTRLQLDVTIDPYIFTKAALRR
ncbi:MAG TPA: outer membrane lipoprotein-sorting protein [Bacteroidetes bacterium]|nr:outer membrane lipoprotein-sorting protein [Bacteroidota bacterium]